MNDQLNEGLTTEVVARQERPIDPLRRVFIPIERQTPNGTTVFRTLDKEIYARLEDGSIRRAEPKLRGKAARKSDKLARRLARRKQ